MENHARYDLKRLRADLHKAATELTALKKEIRQPHHMMTAHEGFGLRFWKHQATQLCCLRAHHRGKAHLADVEKCAALIQEIESRYLLTAESAAA